MKILYDQQIFSFQEYGGISRYFYELVSRIKKTNYEVSIDGKFSNNVYLTKLKKNTIKFLPGFNFPYKNILLFYLNIFFGDRYLSINNFDLLHTTYYQPYFLNKLKGRPYVITVYDMIHELYAKNYEDLDNRTLEYKKKTILNANQIISISENTKKDLIKLYGVPKDKVKVIYLGNPLEGAQPLKVNNLPDKYILFVGNRSGYKNFTFFVNAVAPILKEDKKLFLVCAGGGGFSAEANSLLAKLKIADQVKHINFKNDNELAYIYKNAFVYILPSLYEGFGMTALEAFSMGCPVVASGTSSIPEVCGEAVIYINPKSSDSIREAILKVLSDEKIREKLIKLGIAQVKKFTWQKTVKETLEVYEKVIKSYN
ncbi:MAG: A-glycosyltransferase, glycosyltransferase family 4 protein [Microgenomates group bacterium GW2011_GWC1_43_13]|nr:MAG: A-glycosyltransferase, glycosyltransferase family 4 protein [Microgenomates group bacterium GW2011_GWC1_43_13]